MAIHHAATSWIGVQAKESCSAFTNGRGYVSNQGEAISGLEGDLTPIGRQNTAGAY